ncbi:hypothetical protein ABDK56_11095 [Sphingomonas sp. ASV193]|uniref:hypothetical protein n=1 Tax=Sphingomonas sp. ASV193 TaxID=3144405 RepID=UPI0032E89E9F
MLRKLAITTGLAVTSLFAVAPAASAQSVTFSIGTGSGYGYDSYGYTGGYNGYAYGYPQPQTYGYYQGYNPYTYGAYNGYYGSDGYSTYQTRAYVLAQRRRAEQIARWQRERAREEYQSRGEWDNDDGDD